MNFSGSGSGSSFKSFPTVTGHSDRDHARGPGPRHSVLALASGQEGTLNVASTPRPPPPPKKGQQGKAL
eukprot:1405566-Rhodomonas_salina.2